MRGKFLFWVLGILILETSMGCGSSAVNPPSCADQILNGEETDLDCGGNCPACSSGKRCSDGSDCEGKVCLDGTCQLPTCGDGERNGLETGVDCGGSCPGCQDGESCETAFDCKNKVCRESICQPVMCDDGVNNGTETDVDCGGACPGCREGERCQKTQDCQEGTCAGGLCVAPSCSDGTQNRNETDEDCGGSCPPCAVDKRCVVGSDCESEVCEVGTCQSASCGDRVQNGDETDEDCGGGCPPCADLKNCALGSDCSSGVCEGGTCRSVSCSDRVQNGDETDVDCGGGCSACADLKNCALGSDCSSGVCEGGACKGASCSDRVRNGDETDEDCGGNCPPCADLKACALGSDCLSRVCQGGACQSATCGDRVRNGDETDEDCGGGCPACADGLGCLVGADCLNQVCTGGVCQTSSCTDRVTNGTETGTDCGGGDCPACPDGSACGIGLDCQSGVCLDEVCVPPTCEDGVWNGNETDIDCGSGCPRCDAGLACRLHTDCATLYCESNSCRHRTSCLELLAAVPNAATGVYPIDVDGEAGSETPIWVYCDMATTGGGWTMVLNLDTSDGNVLWWGNPLWTNAAPYGDVATPLDGDLKSAAWMTFRGATQVLLLVHEQGDVVGWKSFRKINGDSMSDHLQGGDNTPIADGVVAANTRQIWENEWLARRSTQLFANHCVQTGGTCTTGDTGSPDGDRIASHESVPSNNRGGGLGNWHDMGYCCAGSLAGRTCNGQTIRTAAEAQSGWCPGYNFPNFGFFGSDSYLPGSCAMNNVNCQTANWAFPNGFNYDYAIFLREDSCNDGLQSGNETGIDCGGVCRGCDPGAHCNQGTDCTSGTCASALCSADFRQSCSALLAAEPAIPSGVYTIDPDGAGPLIPFRVFCDMETEGGGWTVVEKSPFADPVGFALYGDHPINLTNPELPKFRLWHTQMEALQTISSQMQIHCGGTDFLETDARNLFLGEGGPNDCSNRAIVRYQRARLKSNLVKDMRICTWFPGRSEGCNGAFNIDEHAQLASCGLDNYPWRGVPITVASSNTFATDPLTVDPDSDCHQASAIRYVMLRDNCIRNGLKDGTESDVDCGGACSGCPAGQACMAGSDCATGTCLGSTCGPAKISCAELLAADATLPSKRYQIDLDGPGGSAPFEVYCDMTTDGGGWTRRIFEDFESSTSDWSTTNTITSCGLFGQFLGGFNVISGGANSKTYSLQGLPHTQVHVNLDFIKVDSWDGEQASVALDGTEIYRRANCHCFQGCPYCGGAAMCGGVWNEERFTQVSGTIDHTGDTLTLTVSTTLDQVPTDESWGIDNVEIFAR